MKPKTVLSFSFLFLLLSSEFALAAACCGGGSAAPSIISSDDKAQLSTSYSITEVIVANVDNQGIWRKWNENQTVQTLRLEGAHIFQDRWQTGFAVPILQRARQNETHSGLGDIALSLGYEFLPDWNYNPIRPKGIGFLQLTLPTGKSKADSEVGGLDSRGNGFWAIGAGTLLTKSIRRWDLLTSLEVHRSFEKSVSRSSFSGKLEPGTGGNLGIGGGYNWKDYRLGTLITWTYEDSIRSISQIGVIQNTGIERFATTTMSFSYLANDHWSGTLSYTDQTLFGDPFNTSLGRGMTIQMQRRWGR